MAEIMDFSFTRQAIFGDGINGGVSQGAAFSLNGHVFVSQRPGNRAQAASINHQVNKLRDRCRLPHPVPHVNPVQPAEAPDGA